MQVYVNKKKKGNEEVPFSGRLQIKREEDSEREDIRVTLNFSFFFFFNNIMVGGLKRCDYKLAKKQGSVHCLKTAKF